MEVGIDRGWCCRSVYLRYFAQQDFWVIIMDFKLVAKYQPTGDQPRAIAELTQGIKNGLKHQVLLGVTGSGKTFTMANVIEKLNKQNYKTRFCCSGHILHHELVTSNKTNIARILSRKPHGTICRGYIYFDCIPEKFKKIFPKLPNVNYQKLCEMIEDSYTEPVFFFSTDNKQFRSTIEFYYKNSIQEQNKTFEILKQKLFQ